MTILTAQRKCKQSIKYDTALPITLNPSSMAFFLQNCSFQNDINGLLMHYFVYQFNVEAGTGEALLLNL